MITTTSHTYTTTDGSISKNDSNLAWEPIGLEMQITKAEGNIIYEIDGEKASLIFERHLDTKIVKRKDRVFKLHYDYFSTFRRGRNLFVSSTKKYKY